MSITVRSIFEMLSVELWREIFEYFTTNELWFSFRGLNRKIDAILNQTTLHLNFKKKDNYCYFMKNILPLINVNNVRSLKFEKANEIQHFFSKYSFNLFVQLRLLSLDFMYSFNDNSFIFWNQLSSLKYLQFLNIMIWTNSIPDNCIEEKEFLIRSIFNNDYCPSLKSLIIHVPSRQKGMPINPPLMSVTKTTNIKYLWIDSLVFSDLIKLLPGLQNVQSLRTKDEYCYNKFNAQQLKMTFTMPLLLKCIQLNLTLLDDKTFEHVEYFLRHTSNLKDLFLWGWYHLLDARKWEILLSVYCLKSIKFELVCTGHIGDDNFHQAIDDFEQTCKTIPFWLERNVTITDDEDYSGHDYRDDVVVRFNIKKVRFSSELSFRIT
ncbi:unnamed protein product [Rotaria sordida]|uniref:F-box domain-containing protein n=2 Tax=Rotaria sordida TaxID=392033 RepID=A0A815FDL1_9BILA|nr:unnamed protein product [Rotaria sordida]CAF3659510.1 unnamed protein product [Rotaria sordida]